MKGVREISITFPVAVEIPNDVLRQLHDATNLVCEAWERQNPDAVMWAAGTGSRPKWEMGDIAGFDDSVFSIGVSVREAYPSEKIVCGLCKLRRASYARNHGDSLSFVCLTCRRMYTDAYFEPLWKWARDHPEQVPA